MANQQDIRTLVDRFVTDLSVLVHQDALDAVRAALGERPAPKRRGPGRPRKAAKRGPGRPKAAKRGPGRPRKKAGRRSQEDVAALGATVLGHVKASPGQRLEEIGRELGTPTKELKRPIANLLEAGKLRTEGQKRGTKYFAGGRGKAKAKATKKARKAKGRRKAAKRAKPAAKKARRKLSPEQKAVLLERLAKARAARRAAR